MSEAWESTRDFAHVRHPKPGSPALCAFSQYLPQCRSVSVAKGSPSPSPSLLSLSLFAMCSDSKQVMVVTGEGMIYFYTLNLTDGACQFVVQHR